MPKPPRQSNRYLPLVRHWRRVRSRPTRLRAELEAIADRVYRAKHPERAEERGGHDEEPLAARLADALMTLIGIDPDGTPSRATGSSTCRTAVVMTISLNDRTARIVGQGPVPFSEAMRMATSERVDLYAAILGTSTVNPANPPSSDENPTDPSTPDHETHRARAQEEELARRSPSRKLLLPGGHRQMPSPRHVTADRCRR